MTLLGKILDDFTPGASAEMPGPCGRRTRRGTPCTSGVTRIFLSWKATYYAPSCKMHRSTDERVEAEYLELRIEEANNAWHAAPPACHTWPEPDLSAPLTESGEFLDCLTPEDREGYRLISILHDWQDGRCAICGGKGAHREDHCHRSGLFRGYLCSGCNFKEGVYRTSKYDQYRKRPPAAIAGVTYQYFGWGLPDGAEPVDWVIAAIGPRPEDYTVEAVAYLVAAASLDEPKADLWSNVPRIL